MTKRKFLVDRRALMKQTSGVVAGALAAPMIGHAEANTIKIGMQSILSGRVAQLGTSTRNAAMLEVERINSSGGLAGRMIEMVIRDSKGQPQEAARVARELVNADGCEILIDAEASSGAFAVHEVARDLGFLCLHSASETSSLTADPKLHIPNAFRTCRQGIHDAISGGTYAATICKTKDLKTWMTCSPDLRLWARLNRPLRGLPQAIRTGGRDRQRSLAQAVPARLRGPYQDFADQAAGLVFLPFGAVTSPPSSIRAISTGCSSRPRLSRRTWRTTRR